jgi:hypothetical protein
MAPRAGSIQIAADLCRQHRHQRLSLNPPSGEEIHWKAQLAR